jgi:hypothetical protein
MTSGLGGGNTVCILQDFSVVDDRRGSAAMKIMNYCCRCRCCLLSLIRLLL